MRSRAPQKSLWGVHMEFGRKPGKANTVGLLSSYKFGANSPIYSETPRRARIEAINSLKTTEIRTDVGKAMNPDILACNLEEFRDHYWPSPRTDLRRIELIKERLSGKLIDTAPSTQKVKLEREIFSRLKAIFMQIDALELPKKECNRFAFGLVPDDNVSSDVAGANFRIDACVKEPNPNKEQSKFHATNIIVPMEFKVQRNIDTVLQITIEDDRMTLWYFSRSHTAKSRSFDYVKNPDLLIEVLISLMFATDEELGLDPSIQMHHQQDPEAARQYVYELREDDGSRFFSTTKSISEYRTAYVSGRKTRVFKVVEVEKEGTTWREKNGAKPMVLKDVWLNEGAKTEKEIQDALFDDIQNFAERPDWRTDASLKDFCEDEVGAGKRFLDDFESIMRGGYFKTLFLLIRSQHVCLPSKRPIASAWVPNPLVFYSKNVWTQDDERPQEDKNIKPNFCLFAPKRRCFILFSDECTPVDRLPTVGDAFDVLSQCVIALRLLFCVGWVHRDVSTGNVMAIKDANGTWKVKLADLEYAKKFESGAGTFDPKTGTPYFMAHEILAHEYIVRGKRVPQTRFASYA
ncbi:hypothetical protein H1R20_g3098, partial [Candolleomyces eurysporus]